MDIVSEIETAIKAHQDWINHVELMVAMAKNNNDISAKNVAEDKATIQKIRQDNNCYFGKWLYGISDEKIKNSYNYQEIVDFHKQFHQEAAYILVLIFNKEHKFAEELLNEDSTYKRCSKTLIEKMKAWQETFQQ